MIKKLDILILKAFVGPFFATFLISVFVLVLQFFWLYIDDMVGKGLDSWVLLKLIGLVAVTWIPLALPLAVLLSSIMTFGNLGETFELVAIKSAGIPLLRFMRPLLITTIFISGAAFLFTNNIWPVAQLKLESLKHDIIIKQPAFDIKEGVFYNKIPGYIIKVGHKEKDDSTIRNVVMYERNNSLQDNVIVAESGTMRISKDKKFLEFVLQKGSRSTEKGNKQTLQTDYTRTSFDTYKKLLDLSSLQMNKSNDNSFQDNAKMLSLRQLNYTIDSLTKALKKFPKQLKDNFKPAFAFTKYVDTTWKPVKLSTNFKPVRFSTLIPDSIKQTVYNNSIAALNKAKANVSALYLDSIPKIKSLRTNEIEWHRKFTLSFACLVLFFIGAPLGAIIRKGGFGSPLVSAIFFFAAFHLLSKFGEKFAQEFVLNSFAGMWLATFILVPIGIFLTHKAMIDSQLFNSEFYFRLITRFKQWLAIKRNNTAVVDSSATNFTDL